MPRYEIRVNGNITTVTASPDTPLLWVLRDNLNLTGTRFGCGRGYCGACTVHMNGAPVTSCGIPISAVGEAELTTIEGLTPRGDHPLQLAWLQERVPQCGYCQAGQIMRAAALLADDSAPSDDAIDAAMSGNICRCGTYGRIRRAIRRAAAMLSEDDE